jgi:hypothetical protein
MIIPILRTIVIVMLTALAGLDLGAQEPTLRTRWANEVGPDYAHPEYPRPQMVRAEWLNLNGLWQYALTSPDAHQPEAFDADILVPFPIESALSGVQRRVDGQRLWYQRTFTLPETWAGQRVLLHFGAVDWEATVWVNGEEMGTHRGSYDAFSFDITEALTESGENELIVSVWDPTDAGTQPRGKQVRRPESIWYTPTTGIWQTVWLESVPSAYIADFELTPDIDRETLTITVDVADANDQVIQAEARAGAVVIAAGEAVMGSPLELIIENPQLWSPDVPFLYDLTLRLIQDDGEVDTVSSYFGMRKIAVDRDSNGDLRLFLNNAPLFQYGLLDQGFWPDGLYTAPTDEALRYDIEVTKQLGFNTIRKHVKIEPARWYYWADKLGVLVWQDMPSGDAYAQSGAGEITRSAESAAQFEQELQQMIATHDNHPSIVMWVVFNEGWGQYDTARLTEWVQTLDPTRLVNSASGWNDIGTGDVQDFHSYPGPAAPPTDRERVSVLGEFGGLGLPLPGHTWQDQANWGYRQFGDAASLAINYDVLVVGLRELIEKQALAAAIYTQTTDVEIEVNGMMTYDREFVKMGTNAVHDINQIVYEPLPQIIALVPTSEFAGTSWQYTTETPPETWTEPDFDASGWAESPGGFGLAETPVSMIRAEWNTPAIWLRHEFSLDDMRLNAPYLRVHHIEDAELYLNGELLVQLPLSTTDYVEVRFPESALRLLRPGTNVLAVHARRPSFGLPSAGPIQQYIDVGLYHVLRQP